MIATARAAAEAPRTVLFYGLLSIPRTLWACTAPERRHVRRNWRVAGGSANRPTLVASPGGVCYVAADQQSSGMAQNASRSSDPAYDPRIRRFVADLEPMPAGAPSAQQAVGAESPKIRKAARTKDKSGSQRRRSREAAAPAANPDAAAQDTEDRDKRERRRRKRQRAREAKEAGKDTAVVPETGDEPKAREKAHRNRRAAKSGLSEDESSADQTRPQSLTIALVTWEAGRKAFFLSLQEAFAKIGCTVVAAGDADDADILIESGAGDSDSGPNGAKARIVLEPLVRRGEDAEQANLRRRAAIERACATEGIFLPLSSTLRRFGQESELTEDGAPTELTLRIIAMSVRNVALSRLRLRALNACARADNPPDYLQAAALADAPSELLGKISWDSKRVPRALYARFDPAVIEAFLDSKMAFTARKSLEMVPLGSPIDWRMKLPSAPARCALFGLEFLSAVLTYWYQKANGAASDQISEVDAMLKQRAITASTLLARAGETIADFIGNNPPRTPSVAWQESSVTERARSLVLFLLCCKMAAKRRIRFDDAYCAPAFRALLDCLELLRGAEFYPCASVAGIRQDCFLIGAALPLRRIPYGEILLNNALERLNALQLDLKLSPDGVWKGPFSEHCSVLTLLNGSLQELKVARKADASAVTARAQRMARFVEAVLRSNGCAPAAIEAEGRNYERVLASTRALLGKPVQKKHSKIGENENTAWTRSAETYVFRDSGYFISHSSKIANAESSQLVIRLLPVSDGIASAGRILLDISAGARDFVISGELRGGRGLVLNAGTALRIEKIWRGAGWAAVSVLGTLQPGMAVNRTVIHLKAHNAIAVVDEFCGEESGEIEQAWNLPAEFAPLERGSLPLRFGSPKGGVLTITTEANSGDLAGRLACDASNLQSDPSSGGGGPSVRRVKAPSQYAMVTFIGWEETANEAAIEIVFAEAGAWDIRVAGAGLHIQFARRGAELAGENLGA